MKKIIVFRNIIFFIALALFGTIALSLVDSSIEPEEVEEYHYQDTRSDEEKIEQGNYFTDLEGNIIQPTQEELGIFKAKIKWSEFTIKKDKNDSRRVKIVQSFGIDESIDPGNSGYFWDKQSQGEGSYWGNETRRNSNYEKQTNGVVTFHEIDWWDEGENFRDNGVYSVRSEINIKEVSDIAYRSPNYAFINKSTLQDPTVSGEVITTEPTIADSTADKNKGRIHFSANVRDIDDKYRNYGISLTKKLGDTKEVIYPLTEKELGRTPRDEIESWKDDDPINGKHVNFNINWTMENLTWDHYTVKLHGQLHNGSINGGWEEIKNYGEYTVEKFPPEPTFNETKITILDTPHEDATDGKIRVEGSWSFGSQYVNTLSRVDLWVGYGTDADCGTPGDKDTCITTKIEDIPVSKDKLSFSVEVPSLKPSEDLRVYYRVQHDNKEGNHTFTYYNKQHMHTLPSQTTPIVHAQYDEDTNFIPPNATASNGTIEISGSYYDPDNLVKKVETSINNESFIEVDNHDESNNTYSTTLKDFPAGNLSTEVRVTYEAGSTGDDGDRTNSTRINKNIIGYTNPDMKQPITLTPGEADYDPLSPTDPNGDGTNNGTMIVNSKILDVDDQIETIDILYRSIDENEEWKTDEGVSFDSDQTTHAKTINHETKNLHYEQLYEFKIVANLERNGGKVETPPKEIVTTMEQPLEIIPTFSDEQTHVFRPSKWEKNDGKIITDIVMPPKIEGGDEDVDVVVKLKNENDPSYEIVKESQTFELGTTERVEFVGGKDGSIAPGDGYYIQLEYQWEDSNNKTHTITRYTATDSSDINTLVPITVPKGIEALPNIKDEKGIVTNETFYGDADGKIEIEYKVENIYNADAIEIGMQLFDSEDGGNKPDTGIVPGEVPIQTIKNLDPNEDAGGNIDGFSGLATGMYRVEIYVKCKINDDPLDPSAETQTPWELLETVETIEVGVGKDFKPELETYQKVGAETPPSYWGAKDGTLTFKYNITNESGANPTMATFILCDSLGNEVDGAKITIQNPTSGEATFTKLYSGTYTIKSYTSYILNEGGENGHDEEIGTDVFSSESEPMVIETGMELAPGIRMSDDDISTVQPSVIGVEDGKVNFEFDVVNNYNAKIKKFEVLLRDPSNSGEIVDTRTYYAPAAGKITGQFLKVPAGIYSLEVRVDYKINEGVELEEEIAEGKTLFTSVAEIHVETGKEIAPIGNIDNIRTTDVSDNDPTKKSGSETGSIEFDYEIQNHHQASILEVELQLLNSNNNIIQKKEITEDDVYEEEDGNEYSGSYQFSNLSADNYTIKIVSKFKINSETYTETLDEVIVQITRPRETPPTATNEVTIEDEWFNVFIEVYDINNELVTNSLDITIKINGKEEKVLTDQQIGEHSISIKYKKEKIVDWEIIISAEMYGTSEIWHGGDFWNGDVVIYEQKAAVLDWWIITLFVIWGVALAAVGTYLTLLSRTKDHDEHGEYDEYDDDVLEYADEFF